MMKRFFSVLAVFAVCLCILPSCALKADAAKNYHTGFSGDSGRSRIEDERGIFDDNQSDLDELNQMIRDTSEKLRMNILIFAAGTPRNDEATVIFADDSYDEIFGEDTDGVFYYLDLSGKYGLCDHISTSGEAVLKYEKNIDSIFYALDAYLPKSGEEVREEDIHDAIVAFLGQLEKYADHHPTTFEYYHDEASGKYFHYSGGELKITKTKPLILYVKPFFMSLAVNFVIMLIVYLIIKSHYKFKSSADPVVYVSTTASRFTQRSDMLTRTYTDKTRIQSSSGGGSGHRSGGGGHSHSGGHGGGSHHR